MNISIVILTFNSRDTIRQTLTHSAELSDDIHIVDSHSSDETLEIAAEFGVSVSQRAFKNYSDQRNWAIDNLPLKHGWQLHLDADEYPSADLKAAIRALPEEDADGPDGYFIPRLVHFMERPIRHGGMFPIWHMRLFKTGSGRCEDRAYDQHFVLSGKGASLKQHFVDDIRMPLRVWSERHVNWAVQEAREVMRRDDGDIAGKVAADIGGNPLERKRYFKSGYYRLPLFIRPILLFLYRYIIRLGFLDGRAGMVFFILQTFWFRFLVDCLIFEARGRAPGDEAS